MQKGEAPRWMTYFIINEIICACVYRHAEFRSQCWMHSSIAFLKSKASHWPKVWWSAGLVSQQVARILPYYCPMAKFTGACHQAPCFKWVLWTQAQDFSFRKQALYLLSHLPSLHLICFLRIKFIQDETGYSLAVSESFSSFEIFLNSMYYLEHTHALCV